MKKLLVAMIGVIIAVGVVSVSYAMDNTTNMTTLSVSPLKSAAGMLGHVTLTAYDENGNIKAYRQLDNVITNQFDECLTELAFTVTSGNTCTETVGMFNTIVLGTGTPSTAESATTLASYVANANAATGFTTAVMSAATGSNGATLLITSDFALGTAATVSEAALQAGSDTTGAAVEAAIRGFTGIPLGASDTLKVEWTIVIDGN